VLSFIYCKVTVCKVSEFPESILSQSNNSDNTMIIIVSVIVAVVVLAILIVLMVVLLRCYRSKHSKEGGGSVTMELEVKIFDDKL
jgi:heme/copper-type cytochrome/quinol oxidase subunit 2